MPSGTVGGVGHWDEVYTTKAVDDVSWFQPDPVVSFRLVTSVATPASRIVDVGAGASLLVDRLHAAGFRHLTVADVSGAALDVVRERLGAAAADVEFVVADVTAWQPPHPFDVWHDRAVFHFMYDDADRARYLDTMRSAVPVGGRVVVATFAEDGPERCSGLLVRRYSETTLSAAFGDGFVRQHSERQVHLTPWGSEQPFTWVVLVRAA